MDGSISFVPETGVDHSGSQHHDRGNETSATGVGVVVFDNDGKSDSGWACVHGEPPFRVRNPFTLPGDTVWWSNMPADRIAGRAPQSMRSASYLKVPMDLAALELGLTGMAPEEQLGRLAFHFKVITKLVERITAKPFHHVARTRSLATDLLPVAGTSPLIPSELASRFIGPDSRWFVTRIETARAADIITFRAPRLSYAQSLLASNVPANAVSWRQKPEADPMEVIRNTLAPVYAEYAIQRAEPKVAQLFGLAQHGAHLAGAEHALAAHPELCALEAFAKVKIRGYWKGSDYIKASETLPSQLMDALNSKYAAFSWSMGVIANALLQGLCSPFYANGKGGNLSVRGAWLHGVDKVNMFCHAMRFNEAGFRPTSYGHGWIRVLRPELATQNAGLLLVALRNGLLPDPGEFDPSIIAEVSGGTYGKASPHNGWGTGALQAHQFLRQQYHINGIADDMPLASRAGLERREAALQEALRG